MIINAIYIVISLIFLLLSYLIIKSILRGIDGKNKNKK